jgi:hypothetical protein
MLIWVNDGSAYVIPLMIAMMCLVQLPNFRGNEGRFSSFRWTQAILRMLPGIKATCIIAREFALQ